MTGRLVDMSFSLNRKQRITLEVDSDFRNLWDKLNQEPLLDIEIKKHRNKRSHSANAYFHIGMFDVDQCRKVVRIMREERNQLWKI